MAPRGACGIIQALMKTALLAGATGLVGSHCLELLLNDSSYERVIAVTRRPLGRTHPRLAEAIVDFENPSWTSNLDATDIFWALGTTIGKAGSKEAFRRVDFEYPRQMGQHAAGAGAKQFLLVSSVSADPGSPNFYLRIKGELEQTLFALPFDAVHIFRPSFLMGDRVERRTGEAFGIAVARALSFTLVGPLRRFRPIAAETVAGAMVSAASLAKPGRHIYHYDAIVVPDGKPAVKPNDRC
jgi:uncharacterized protein YbjT (DUF2867 family)